jgi:uncharacterized SAM-binding protein YcdF (DUF218 family)
MSPREELLVVLSHLPLLKSDAIVVLTGEDWEPRVATAIEMMRTGGAPVIVLSGGVDSAFQKSAKSLHHLLIGMGVAPGKIELEDRSQNTREQACNIVELASQRGWKRILLVASAYHIARAYLTFVKAVREAGLEKDLHICAAPAHGKWFENPQGASANRFGLLGVEMDKIERYAKHVATFNEGLDYIKAWEGL